MDCSYIVRMCSNRGGEDIENVSDNAHNLKIQCTNAITSGDVRHPNRMPASMRIITAGEIRDSFVTRRSLLDTETDAYLRQDVSLMSPIFPSSTVIHTAVPDQLKA